MKWIVSAIVIGVVVVGYLVLRGKASREKTTGGFEVASYEEIKRRIREGDVPAQAAPEAPQKPPVSLDEVFDLKDSNEFVSALWDNLSYKAAAKGEGSLSASEAAVLDIIRLEAEVNNGGFDQYFFNSAGDRAVRVPAALESIGARKVADIVRRALALFENGQPSTERERRWRQMEMWKPADKDLLGRLDDEFYGYPDPIPDLVAAHCRQHRADFAP